MYRKTLLIVVVAMVAVLGRPVGMSAVLGQTPEKTKADEAGGAEPAKTPPGDDAKPAKAKRSDKVDPVSPQSQPTAKDIINAFESERPVNRPVRTRTRSTGRGRESDKNAARLMRDGQYVNKARGRLVREALWWTFVSESDTPDSPIPPLRLLPNQQLARIVMESEASAEKPVFVLSGEVTLFESQNFLLIRTAMRSRTTQNLEK